MFRDARMIFISSSGIFSRIYLKWMHFEVYVSWDDDKTRTVETQGNTSTNLAMLQGYEQFDKLDSVCQSEQR